VKPAAIRGFLYLGISEEHTAWWQWPGQNYAHVETYVAQNTVGSSGINGYAPSVPGTTGSNRYSGLYFLNVRRIDYG